MRGYNGICLAGTGAAGPPVTGEVNTHERHLDIYRAGRHPRRPDPLYKRREAHEYTEAGLLDHHDRRRLSSDVGIRRRSLSP